MPVEALDQGLLTADPDGAIDVVLAVVEARFPVRATIHDRSGVLHDSAGQSATAAGLLLATDRSVGVRGEVLPNIPIISELRIPRILI